MSREATENAWALHQVQLDWTSKADAKAAFVFSIDAAAIAAAVSIFSGEHRHVIAGSALLLILLTVAASGLAAGIAFSAWAVAPRLRSRAARKAARHNFIYFGHARHWKASDLERQLSSKALVRQLSRNTIVAADIAWKKHRAVTLAIWFTLAGGLALGALVIGAATAA